MFALRKNRGDVLREEITVNTRPRRKAAAGFRSFLEQFVRRQSAQLGQRFGSYCRRKRRTLSFRFCQKWRGASAYGAEESAAFSDGLLEQVARERRRHQRAHGQRSSRFAADGDLARIPSKSCDVLANPLQRGHLIEKPVVSRRLVRRLRSKLRMREKPENSQAVVDVHHHNAVPGDAFAVVACLIAAAGGKPAAIKPDVNR